MDSLLYIGINLLLFIFALFFCFKAPLLGVITSLFSFFFNFSVTEVEFFNSGTFTIKYIQLIDIAPIIIIMAIIMLISSVRVIDELREWDICKIH